MSFFGFDVTLPRDRPAAGGGGSGGGVQRSAVEDAFDPAFDPTYSGDYDEEEDEDPSALDAKISALTAGAQEDVAVYTWGEEDYDGLGDRLDEDGDAFNEDTFGVGDIGTDFDFGHGTSAPAGEKASAAPPAGTGKAAPAPSKFASTLDDFMTLDGARSGPRAGAAPSRPAPKTMEEIEAEMRSSRISEPPAQQQQQYQQQLPPQMPPQQFPPFNNGGALPPPGAHGRPLTMEEIEAQMRQARGSPAQMPPAQLPPPQQALQQPPQVADLASIMQQQQQEQQRLAEASRGMPLGRGPAPPAAIAMQQAAQAQAQAQAHAQSMHAARMKALLDSMPGPVQQAILGAPPALQFESLDEVVDAFPALRQARSADVSKEDVAKAVEMLTAAAVSHIHTSVNKKLAERARQEAAFHRRVAKIQAMSKYNGLMTRSDQDFITRIQVSQLVTQDPYADDFYAHIYFALRGGRGPAAPVLAGGSDDQKRGKKQPRLSRRENAMLRMQQQVERIVKHRKERDEKAGKGTLEGALGKITTSSTKGMRPMLSLSGGVAADAVRAALAGASLDQTGAPGQKRQALGTHEVLRILEKLYDTVLALEQLRRAGLDDAELEQRQSELTATLWTELRVLEPLDISDPHPFVSLLSTIKGKRLLPRALRHLSPEQTLTTMTMIVASFQSLDVVKRAHLLDGDAGDSEARRDVERQTEAFANSIVPSMMQLIATAPMKIVSGMLAVFIERNDAIKVAQSRPGIAFLTIFLSRAESLKQGGVPSAEDREQWSQIFSLLFSRLSGPGMLPSLFPSTRARASLPFGPGYYMSGAFGAASLSDALKESKRYRNIDVEDEPVWNFMAALAVACSMDQQQTLVAELRDKILENVVSAKEWAKRKKERLTDELSAAGFHVDGAIPGIELGPDMRIRNVNLLLHALNLDATQIAV